MLGKKLHDDINFYPDLQLMVEFGIIPPSASKLWARSAPAWARPFTWVLFHDFHMISSKDKLVTYQFKLDTPKDSILDKNGNWHGQPAKVVKVFKRSGEPVLNMATKMPVSYEVTIETATALADHALNWKKSRPFPYIPDSKLQGPSVR